MDLVDFATNSEPSGNLVRLQSPFLQCLCNSSSLADRLVYEPSGTVTKLIKLCSVRMAAHANSRNFSPCPQLLPQWKWTPINTKTS